MLVAAPQTDPSLLPFLTADDVLAEATALARLNTEEIEPIIRRGIAYKLHFYRPQFDRNSQRPEFEEIYNDVQLRLLKRLRALKQDPAQNQIANLRSYVATVTRNTCDEYLRQKYPMRRSLRDRVRRHLLNNPAFALWEDADDTWLAGLSHWPNRSYRNGTGNTTGELREQLQARWQSVDVHRLPLDDLLHAVFDVSRVPLDLDQLTALVAGFLGVEDHPVEPLDGDTQTPLDRHVSAETDHATVTEQRQVLQFLWREICQLPRRQRVALLLNLKNPHGINIITLLPATGIATFEQLAQALEIPAPEFEQLWADLPLDDLRLAAYLGATRQQVINLRKTARERLLKRMSAIR